MKLINYFMIALGLTIIISAIFKNFYTGAIIGTFIFIFSNFGIIHYLENYKRRLDALNKRELSMNHWFNVTNYEISKMGGGQVLVWDEGIDTKYEPMTTKVAGQWRKYISFVARTKTKPAVVILDITDIKFPFIARYDTTNNSEMFNNPYHEFNPEKSGGTMGFNPYDRFNNRDKGMTFNIGGKDKQEEFDINEEYAKRVAGDK